MLDVISSGDVTRLRCASRLSRAFGYEVSAYLVRGVLVDTAFPYAWPDLARWLDAARGAGTGIDGVLVTHHHEDHAGNVAALAARGLPVGMAPATLDRLRQPGRVGRYRRHTWGPAPRLTATPAPFAHEALELVPAPGHTADHHVVWDRERGTLFGGDLYIGVKVRIAHPGEDVRGQAAVLRRVAALEPARFFDAHRGPVERPAEQLRAKAQWIDDVVGAIERHAAAGMGVRAITAEVLGRGDLTALVSAGDYAKRNLVESVLALRDGARAGSTNAVPAV